MITHDLDTRSESAGILGAVIGASSEAYRKEIARRTRRGLEGLARNGKPTGGCAYGYVSATDSETGQLEIHPERADVVRRIFSLYATGISARAIAAALNADRVPPPGSRRERTATFTKGWVMSAIAGSVRDGLGILNNEIYIGRVIWNRFRWVRSAADSSRRRREPNPKSEWIERREERLRIVDQSLWNRVKARQRQQTDTIGERVRRGLANDTARRTGRGPKYLFSGLLKCGKCGSNFVVCNAQSYACANRVNGGPCDSDVTVRRIAVEAGLLAGIQNDLLAPEVIAEVCRRATRLARMNRGPECGIKAIAKLRAEISNLTDAIANGALRASPAIAERLRASERELERLEATNARPARNSVEHMIPRLADEYRALIADLAQGLTEISVPRARAELRKLIGEIRVDATEDGVEFRSEHGVEAALMKAAGGGHQQICVVAGVGFEPTTFGL